MTVIITKTIKAEIIETLFLKEVTIQEIKAAGHMIQVIRNLPRKR